MPWVWFAVIASVLLSTTVIWVEEEQNLLVSQYTGTQDLLRQVRVDMVKGYMQVTIAEQSPPHRERGLALLRRAERSLRRADSLHRAFDGETAESGTRDDSRARLSAFLGAMSGFRRQIETVGSAAPGDAAWRMELHDAYLALERDADDVDARMRKDLKLLTDTYDGLQMLVISGSAVLLTFICIVVFVTTRGRKLTERALRESEELYGSILASSPDDIVITDLEGRILKVSAVALPMFGLVSADEALGRPIGEYVAPEDRERALATVAQMFEGIVPGRGEFRGLRADGSSFDMEATAQFIPGIDGKPAKMLFIVRDVTERKRIERDYQILFREMIDGFALHDIICDEGGEPVDYRFIAVNPAFEQATGLRAADITGKTVLEVIPDIEAVWIHTYGRVAMTGEPAIFENYAVALDKYFSVRAYRPAPGQFATIFVDITARKRGEQKERAYQRELRAMLRLAEESRLALLSVLEDQKETEKALRESEQATLSAKDRAERSERLKDAFIANISHEIRTPLNIILGYTNVIAERFHAHAGDGEHRYFDSVQRGGERLMRTVDMILNMSRLQAGEFTLKPAPVNISQLLRKIVADHQPIAQKKSLRLSAVDDDRHAVVVADEYCITQAVSNLVHNAIKFTQQGGVELRVFRDDAGRLCISCSDTGIGIAADYIPLLFERYSQEESGYSRPFEGLGLGMALVKEYLERNGAAIAVTSEKGAGTTFTITFHESVMSADAAEAADVHALSAQAGPARRARGRNEGRPTVLLIEDDEMTVDFMNVVLEERYTIRTARSATDAWEILRATRIDIILMDISLAGETTGLELTQEIRQSPAHRSIPIIAVTAHAYDSDRDNCFDAGCDDFIRKPIDSAVVLGTMDRLLAR